MNSLKELFEITDIEWEKLEYYLAIQVKNFIKNAPERLLQIAYRLDLPEQEFKEAFSKQDVSKIVEIILKREQKRLEFRKNYKT